MARHDPAPTDMTLLKTLVLGALLAGCIIEQPATQPRSAGDLRGAPGGSTPSGAHGRFVSGDFQVDPQAVANAVAASSGQLGRCFIGSGQVDLVVTIDARGRATDVQGPGDPRCLAGALQGEFPPTSMPTQVQVSLWVEAAAPGAVDASTETAPGSAEPAVGGAPAPAPEDVLLVTVTGVRVDERRPDGRPWDEDGTGWPDVRVVLYRNGAEVLRTEVVADSSIPAFRDAHARSLRLASGDVLRFEILDDDPGGPEVIARFEVPPPTPAHVQRGIWEIGAAPPMQLLTIRLGPPRSLVGTGIRWELRRGALEVLEVALDSPASEAGVRPGDRVVEVDGRRVRGQTAAALEASFRGEAGTRMRLKVEHAGAGRDVVLERRAIYY